MSKLIYFIQLWGGCSKYLIICLQSLENRAARIVTRKDWFTSVITLLLQGGWLSVHQLAVYHSLILVYQVKTSRKPYYFSNKLNTQFSRETRLAASDGIRIMERNRLSLTKWGFRVRASVQLNALPIDVRQSKNISSFKRNLRAWILKNVSLYP